MDKIPDNKDDSFDDLDNLDDEKYQELLKEADKHVKVTYLKEDQDLDYLYDEDEEGELNDQINDKIENNNDELQSNSKLEEELKIQMERRNLIENFEFPNFNSDGEIYSIDLFSKSGILLIGDGEDTYYAYDVVNKKLLKKEKIHTDSVTNVKFSFDGELFVTASLDGIVKIFKSSDFSLLYTIDENKDEVTVRL